MSERYTKLYSLPSQMAVENSEVPVEIEAGALLKDSRTKKLIAQIKYQNISQKSIKEMTIAIKTFDASGSEIKGTLGYVYRKLDAAEGDSFGDRTPITILNADAESFEVEIVNVTFSDGSKWSQAKEKTKETVKNVGNEAVKVFENIFAILRRPSKKLVETALLVGNCLFSLVMIYFIGKYIGRGVKNTAAVIELATAVLIFIITIPYLGKVIFKKSGYGLFQRYVRWGSALAVYFIAQIIFAIVTWQHVPATKEQPKTSVEQNVDQENEETEDIKNNNL